MPERPGSDLSHGAGTASKTRLLLRQGAQRQKQVTRGNHGDETDETGSVKVTCHCLYLERVQLEEAERPRRFTPCNPECRAGSPCTSFSNRLTPAYSHPHRWARPVF